MPILDVLYRSSSQSLPLHSVIDFGGRCFTVFPASFYGAEDHIWRNILLKSNSKWFDFNFSLPKAELEKIWWSLRKVNKTLLKPNKHLLASVILAWFRRDYIIVTCFAFSRKLNLVLSLITRAQIFYYVLLQSSIIGSLRPPMFLLVLVNFGTLLAQKYFVLCFGYLAVLLVGY